MRRLSLSVLFFLSVLAASSQRLYFIYFQTESKQPFFIKMDEKLYSSTTSGYLILSRLRDSTYNFVIGFPGNQFPEQKFSCSIARKDHGFMVKNFGEKGWGLVDLQTQAVQMAGNDTKKDVSVTNTPVNAFTDLLSKAADDPTLKQKIVLPDEKKPETVARATATKEVKKDSAAVTADTSKPVVTAPSTIKNEGSRKEVKKDTALIAAGTAKPPASLKTNTTGESIKKDTKKDSVAAATSAGNMVKANKPGEQVIKEIKKDSVVTTPAAGSVGTTAKTNPQEKATNKPVDNVNKNIQAKKEDTTTQPLTVKTDKADPGIQKETKIQSTVKDESSALLPVFAKSKVARTAGVSTTEGFDLTFTDTYPDGKQDVIKIVIPEENKASLSTDAAKDEVQKKTEPASTSSAPAQQESAVKNGSRNNCRQIASDADFYKLRKKMASDKSDASMLDDANKAFRSKCFTSSQVKNLSGLFLGDGGKYSFFDAAYPHIADLENFAALESELKDEYFINRFKAMLR